MFRKALLTTGVLVLSAGVLVPLVAISPDVRSSSPRHMIQFAVSAPGIDGNAQPLMVRLIEGRMGMVRLVRRGLELGVTANVVDAEAGEVSFVVRRLYRQNNRTYLHRDGEEILDAWVGSPAYIREGSILQLEVVEILPLDEALDPDPEGAVADPPEDRPIHFRDNCCVGMALGGTCSGSGGEGQLATRSLLVDPIDTIAGCGCLVFGPDGSCCSPPCCPS